WDVRSWDTQKKEDQWSCLARVVRERNPGKIAVNESDDIWAADGLTVSLKQKIVKALGPEYSGRLHSGEKLSTLWLMTLLDEELELYERVVAVAHALIAETFSGKAVTPGVTTTDDLLFYYLQRVSDLGLENYAWPWFRIRARDPEVLKKYGKDDIVIRRGDFIHCDVGIRYLRYYTDHAEWAYVLRPGETDAPPGYKKLMAEANRLQDIFCGEFKAGLSGNQLLRNILDRARREGIANPKIYSHSIGYYLHEPGPLIGLPWEQEDTGGRGEVRLVPNSTFTAELSVACPVPELGGQEMTMALEQVVAFTPKGTYFIDGRQTAFHLIK
ncbi:MAG: aminopeptidase P family protein, partial [Candidatus Aminicenantes bacterium]|nr:aminopeptidase P family protein [Candidatus Aminicenantes bacterium]